MLDARFTDFLTGKVDADAVRELAKEKLALEIERDAYRHALLEIADKADAIFVAEDPEGFAQFIKTLAMQPIYQFKKRT